MARRPPVYDDSILSHALRLLAARRFELYSSLCPLMVQLEDAIDEKGVRRIIETFAEIRRRLRESLAFLTRPLYEALREMEQAMETGGTTTGGVATEPLKAAMLRLHVELSRSIRKPGFEPVEDILGLGIEARTRLRASRGPEEDAAPGRRIEKAMEKHRKGWAHVSGGKYRRAVRELGKAVALMPEDPRLRADLGQALYHAGDPAAAVAELTRSLERYASEPAADPAGRRWASRILGKARRDVAERKFKERRVEDAIAEIRTAIQDLIGAFEGSTEPAGEESGHALRAEIDMARDRLAQWEAIWKKVSGEPDKSEASAGDG